MSLPVLLLDSTIACALLRGEWEFPGCSPLRLASVSSMASQSQAQNVYLEWHCTAWDVHVQCQIFFQAISPLHHQLFHQMFSLGEISDYAEWTHWKKCVGLQWGTQMGYITFKDFCKIIRTQSSTIWCHMLVKDLIHDFGFLSETENRRFRPRVERMNLDPDISGMLGEHVCMCVCECMHTCVCVCACVYMCVCRRSKWKSVTFGVSERYCREIFADILF